MVTSCIPRNSVNLFCELYLYSSQHFSEQDFTIGELVFARQQALPGLLLACIHYVCSVTLSSYCTGYHSSEVTEHTKIMYLCTNSNMTSSIAKRLNKDNNMHNFFV